jgi:hypothetical protein
MLGVRLGVVGILTREDVKILTVYVDLSVICVVSIANTDLNTPNKTTTIVGSNLQANANNADNAVNSDNTNNTNKR